MVFIQVYLLVSVLAFAFGPVDQRAANPWSFYPYVLFGQAILGFGYWLGTARDSTEIRKQACNRALTRTCIVVMLGLLPATIVLRNYAGLSVVEALANPAEAYNARLDALNGSAAGSLLAIVRGVCAPLGRSAVPLGLVFWNQLSNGWRLAWLASAAGAVVDSILAGAAIGIFEIALVVPWMIWLRQLRYDAISGNTRPGNNTKPSLLARLPRYTLLLAVAVFTLQYFAHSRQARYGLSGNEYPSGTVGWSKLLYGVNLPASIEYPSYTLIAYLTNGYNGLSECMEMPFVPCYGVGHSSVLMRYAGAIAGDPEYFWSRCYPARLEAEASYSAKAKWHTIYPWLASDLTFGGALIAVGFIGYLLARVWASCLHGDSTLAIAFFAQVIMLCYYIPANNCRLSFSEEALAFWGLFAAWVVYKPRLSATT